MAEIISFVKKPKKVSGNRWKAIAEDNLKVYVCDGCGEEFEVIVDNKPDKCPGCGKYINWYD